MIEPEQKYSIWLCTCKTDLYQRFHVYRVVHSPVDSWGRNQHKVIIFLFPGVYMKIYNYHLQFLSFNNRNTFWYWNVERIISALNKNIIFKFMKPQIFLLFFSFFLTQNYRLLIYTIYINNGVFSKYHVYFNTKFKP